MVATTDCLVTRSPVRGKAPAERVSYGTKSTPNRISNTAQHATDRIDETS